MTSANGWDLRGTIFMPRLSRQPGTHTINNYFYFLIQGHNLKKTITLLPTRQKVNYFVLKIELDIYF